MSETAAVYETNDFTRMAGIDVSTKVEKKGKFAYLSWPFAVAEFRKNCPNGTWATIKHNGSPVLTTEQGHFVEIEVTPDIDRPLIKFSQLHPILDSNNKPVATPSAFQVNTSIQRCLVKAIAIATGIGLYIYAGEDLPDAAEKNTDHDKAFDKASVTGWCGLCTEAAEKKDIAAFRAWFETHKADILADCNADGLEMVRLHWVAEGLKLAKS